MLTIFSEDGPRRHVARRDGAENARREEIPGMKADALLTRISAAMAWTAIDNPMLRETLLGGNRVAPVRAQFKWLKGQTKLLSANAWAAGRGPARRRTGRELGEGWVAGYVSGYSVWHEHRWYGLCSWLRRR